MSIRAKQAGEILGVSAVTVRAWSKQGLLPYKLSASGQMTYTEEDLQTFYRQRLGLDTPSPDYWFYLRTSGDNDVLLETQEAKLAQAHTATKVYKDKASGLNENRKGLNRLLDDLQAHAGPVTICVTNKDRLSRFGVKYLERLINAYGGTLEVLDSDETKEPHEVLMQDFLSLLASFSGKFYRLRGHDQRKKFLKEVTTEVEHAAHA